MRYGSVQACFGSETLLSVVLGALSDTFSLVWVDDALVPGHTVGEILGPESGDYLEDVGVAYTQWQRTGEAVQSLRTARRSGLACQRSASSIMCTHRLNCTGMVAMSYYPESLILGLEARPRQLRIDSLDMIYRRKAGHPGGTLSAAEIIAALLFHKMRLDPQRPDWPEPDRHRRGAFGHRGAWRSSGRGSGAKTPSSPRRSRSC